jgi:hypothetical protein
MSIKDTIQPLVVSAQEAGINLPLGKLRDAICRVLYDGKTFSPLMAAEAAGQRITPGFDFDAIPAVAGDYRIDPAVFAGVFGPIAEVTEHGEDGLALHPTLKDRLLDGPCPLFRQYPRQAAGQAAYVEMNKDGVIDARYNTEIGNPVSLDVWHSRTLHFPVPCLVNGRALLDFLNGEGRGLLARIHAEHVIKWDGSNHVGRLGEPAWAVSEALCRKLEALPVDAKVWSVDEWVAKDRLEDVWPDGSTLDAAAEALHASFPAWNGSPSAEAVQGDLEDCREVLIVKLMQVKPFRLSRWQARQLTAFGEWSLATYARWIAEYSDETAASVQEAELDGRLISENLLDYEEERESDASWRPVAEIGRGMAKETGRPPIRAYLAHLIYDNGARPVLEDLVDWGEWMTLLAEKPFKTMERMDEAAAIRLA